MQLPLKGRRTGGDTRRRTAITIPSKSGLLPGQHLGRRALIRRWIWAPGESPLPLALPFGKVYFFLPFSFMTIFEVGIGKYATLGVGVCVQFL